MPHNFVYKKGFSSQSTAGGVSDDEEDDWIRKPGMSGFVKL
jgi:hypothetical protein